VFDRDGTLIDHVEYLHRVEEIKFVPGTFEILKKLLSLKYRLGIITNQSLINRKIGTYHDVNLVNKHITQQLALNKISIDFILVCPHTPDENCNCRKPKQQLMNYAIEKFGLKPKVSFMVGDSESDMEFGKKALCTTIQIAGAKKRSKYADYFCENLLEAYGIISSAEIKQYE
jgi:histidinol-phosphate phosphatase family protein